MSIAHVLYIIDTVCLCLPDDNLTLFHELQVQCQRQAVNGIITTDQWDESVAQVYNHINDPKTEHKLIIICNEIQGTETV